MNDPSVAPKGTSFNLEKFVDYASGSVVSKTLLGEFCGKLSQSKSESPAVFERVQFMKYFN